MTGCSCAMLHFRRPIGERNPPWRLTKDTGPPRCIIEAVAQEVHHHRVLIFIAIMTTATLLAVLFNIRLR